MVLLPIKHNRINEMKNMPQAERQVFTFCELNQDTRQLVQPCKYISYVTGLIYRQINFVM